MNGGLPVYVVRHGATKMNNQTDLSQDRIRGWSDVPLAPQGEEEARQAAEKLKPFGIKVIVTSDLQRAVETAKIISQILGGIPIQVNHNLRPWNLGDFTGANTKESLPKIAEFAQLRPNVAVPGGSSFDQFKAQANKGLSEAIMVANGRPLAVVTHHRDERLWRAEQAVGWTGEVDLATFLQAGDPPGGVFELNVDPAAIMRLGGGPPIGPVGPNPSARLGAPPGFAPQGMAAPGTAPPGAPPPGLSPTGMGAPGALPPALGASPGAPVPPGLGAPPMGMPPSAPPGMAGGPLPGPPPGMGAPAGPPGGMMPSPGGSLQMPVPGGMPGAPPAPPNPMLPMLQKFKEILKAIDLLRRDVPRGYRVDIEIDTMVAGDHQQERVDATEFIKSITQFVQAASMIVPHMPQFAPLAAKMLQFGVRKFRTGRDLEASIDEFADQITKMSPQQLQAMAPQPPGAQQNKQLQQQGAAQVQAEQTRAQAEIAKAKLDAQAAEEDDKRNAQLKALEFQMKMQEFRMRMAEMERGEQLKIAEHNRKMQSHVINTMMPGGIQ